MKSELVCSNCKSVLIPHESDVFLLEIAYNVAEKFFNNRKLGKVPLGDLIELTYKLYEEFKKDKRAEFVEVCADKRIYMGNKD